MKKTHNSVLFEHAETGRMTLDEKIEFMNISYFNLPENLRVGRVKRPQPFNFVKMKHPNAGTQKETFAARLIRLRKKYHLSQTDLAFAANQFASKYGSQVTIHDICNYENKNVCPKIDKMTAISEALGVSINYFAGYGPEEAHVKNPVIEARSRIAS